MNLTISISLLSLLFVLSCTQNTPIYSPIGGLEKNTQNYSQNRSKQLNELERAQIQDWINKQNKKFYPTQLNYWTDIENIEQRERKKDGERISYEYYLYDFNQSLFYEKPILKHNVILGKLKEIIAVEHTLRYLKKGEKVTLLVPSILAFGTYGDEKEIPHDMPLIIKLTILK